MADDSFHLTPLDVRRTEFPAAIRGYDKSRVDDFRERVADELERLTRINHDLETKAKGFYEQLRAFRERDKALNEALVSAQQLRADTREQAVREAQLLLREAQADGDRILDAAKGEVRRLMGEIEGLERARRAYLAQLRTMVARQLAELDAIPEPASASALSALAPASTSSPASPASGPGGASVSGVAPRRAATDGLDDEADSAEDDDGLADSPPARPSTQTPTWLESLQGE